MNESERLRLIDDLLDGELSEADFLRLEAEMIVNEEARQAYYERQKLHTGLHLEANEGGSGSEGENARGSRVGAPRRIPLDRYVLSALVLLIALVGFIGWKLGQDSQAAELVTEPVVFGFGVLASESELIWGGESELNEGDLIEGGVLDIEAGTAKLEFFNGVEVILSGPVQFEVVSGLSFVLHRGEGLFLVPDSVTDVSVQLPSGRIENAGPEFFAMVGESSEQVEVLSGLVDWKRNSGEARRIERGDGLRLDQDGAWQAFQAEKETMKEVEARLSEVSAERRQAWEQVRESWLEDQRVIAWYFLGSGSGSAMRENSGNQSDGEVIRSKKVEDRWGVSDGGLDFSPTGSRVRVDVDGSFDSLTLVCWVKIDSLDRQFNSLFLTDGHELFEPHWQLMSDGRIFFSVKAKEGAKGPDKHIVYSPSVWNPSRIGHWMQIATVFDGGSNVISHYMNGAKVGEEQIPEEFIPEKVEIGSASIGNWSEPRYRKTPEFAIRNLNGKMDELALFSEPLSADEIQFLYQNGKP